ncbi:TauD/TfdA family dioxygenase [Pigmentiphaga soli]|uniref:TauD/TfdA family dioxygenase n=1 Tax=Pigmentiphaga soli TaxID=1007095 RepID=A0ABP8GS75_9BURK
MSHTITPLTPHQTGAEIRGLDLSQPVSDRLRAELNAALARHGVLVFRDQDLPPERFKRAAQIFGEIMPHHRRSGDTTEDSSIFEVKNLEVAPGKYYIVGESFHTDHSNDPVPPKATVLHPVALPDRGGDTQFVNVHAAYDDLAEPMKKRIDKLLAVHVYVSQYSPRKLIKVDDDTAAHLPPPAIHPLVRIHPENGRKYLYLNPVRMDSIIGMPDDEAQALIAELMAHATQQRYEYRHQWKYGDMVIWDNRSVMHQANADYDMTQLRKLYRIMIKGQLHESDLEATRGVEVDLEQRVPS